MQTTKKQNKIPIEYDISFKYICENCGCSHWLFMREVKVEGFFIVCDCGDSIYPKPISDIEIIYKDTEQDAPEVPDLYVELSEDVQRLCISTLKSFGYSDEESKRMIDKTYEETSLDDATSIIEYIMQNLEVE